MSARLIPAVGPGSDSVDVHNTTSRSGGAAAYPVKSGAGWRQLLRGLEGMNPAYFGMVMATGIVAIASHLMGLRELALILAGINLLAYPGIWCAFLLRVMLVPERVWSDFANHQRAPGFFTMVAGTGVIGVQAVLIHGRADWGQGLWWLTLTLWLALNYSIFALLTIKEEKPGLAEGINGGWLLAVVATQSVCVLGVISGAPLARNQETGLYLMMALWLSGGMLYLWIIALIFYRYLFFEFRPADLMPPYWINMGAVAISTLAGAVLAGGIEASPLLSPLRPFVLGLSVAFWATATWWIPMLLVLGVWRHSVRGVRFGYDPLYWGLVFPLGMYATCTYRLSGMLPVPVLPGVAKTFMVLAAVAWLLNGLGFAARVLHAGFVLWHDRRPRRSSAVTTQPVVSAAGIFIGGTDS